MLFKDFIKQFQFRWILILATVIAALVKVEVFSWAILAAWSVYGIGKVCSAVEFIG